MQVVWYKKDLRVFDHAPLLHAAEIGPILPLYVVEPELWAQADSSARQWAFVAETLQELRDSLGALGQPLIIRIGRIKDVLDDLKSNGHLSALWSHEETGNDWTFQRDKRVAAWCRAQSVPWTELQNHGVWRRQRTRNGWANRWDHHMSASLLDAPSLNPVHIEIGVIPTARDLKLTMDPCPDRQIGGRKKALETLDSFFTRRGEFYQHAMSSPLEGATACSRMSPYLTWGAVSMREVAQTTAIHQASLAPAAKNWRKSLRSFSGRLHWHCHFIQKLEDEPRIEFENMHRLYDGLRPKEPDQTRLDAWKNGETGYPFLDACMRSLRATGWLNFRMRAMVMATASYHLWLDWRAPGLHLARMFTDYEPGIHWSQVQMQSGTTGINAVRIYNPLKQGFDQDPDGAFIRRWIPELSNIENQYIHEPWKSPRAEQIVGRTYPDRVFDHMSSAKAAREKIWGVKRAPGFHDTAQGILSKHGSRKTSRRGRRASKPKDDAQLTLPFGDT